MIEEITLSKNFMGIFMRIVVIPMSYLLLILLPLMDFSFLEVLLTKGYKVFPPEALFASLFLLFFTVFSLFIFKRFPFKVQLNEEFLVMRFAIPFFRLKYKRSKVKLSFKNQLFAGQLLHCLYIKTSLDPLPVALLSQTYSANWSRIQSIVESKHHNSH